MRKIIIFSTTYLPLIGGAELAVKEITGRITDCEFDLICACLRRDLSKKEKIGRVNIYRIGFGSKIDKILLPLLGFLKARKIYKQLVISDKQLTVIWGIMASWGSLAALIFKTFNPQVPFFLTLQEGDAEGYIKRGRWGLINLSWHWLLRRADYVQVISNYLADMARKYGYGGEIDVVPNGVDIKKFSMINFSARGGSAPGGQFSKDSFKNKLNIKEGEKIIITVSRLVEKNGIIYLIRAMKELEQINPELKIKLLVVGSGELENSLKAEAEKLGLSNKVLFLGEIINEKVPQYLAMSDIFVRPSLSEGLGTAFLEAMAAGVPVIATLVGGIPDFLKDGETGLFCKIKNSADIAGKIKLLLEDSEIRNKIIINARRMVEEKYDWNIIAKQMSDIFKEL